MDAFQGAQKQPLPNRPVLPLNRQGDAVAHPGQKDFIFGRQGGTLGRGRGLHHDPAGLVDEFEFRNPEAIWKNRRLDGPHQGPVDIRFHQVAFRRFLDQTGLGDADIVCQGCGRRKENGNQQGDGY